MTDKKIHLIKPNYKCTDEVVPEGEVLLLQKGAQQTDEDFEAECSTYGGEYSKETGCRMRKELIEGTGCQYIQGRETHRKIANIAKTEEKCSLLGMGQWDAESKSCTAEVCVALDQACPENANTNSSQTQGNANSSQTQENANPSQTQGDTVDDMDPLVILAIGAGAAVGLFILLGILYSLFTKKPKNDKSRALELATNATIASVQNLEEVKRSLTQSNNQ